MSDCWLWRDDFLTPIFSLASWNLSSFIKLIANFRHSRENGNPEVFEIPGFRVAPAIASLPGMTPELWRELQFHHTSDSLILGPSPYLILSVALLICFNREISSLHRAVKVSFPGLVIRGSPPTGCARLR